MVSRLHVIDGHVGRRAWIARELNNRGLHTEIYESLEEFQYLSPDSGALFAADDFHDDGGQHVSVLRQSIGSLPLVLYAEQICAPRVVEAIHEGALDYLHWPFEPKALEKTFRRIETEGIRRTQQADLEAAARARVDLLTRREREVLGLLVHGMSNREMGDTMSISPRTVEIHRAHMMDKLQARSTGDAVRIALYAGLDDRNATAILFAKN